MDFLVAASIAVADLTELERHRRTASTEVRDQALRPPLSGLQSVQAPDVPDLMMESKMAQKAAILDPNNATVTATEGAGIAKKPSSRMGTKP